MNFSILKQFKQIPNSYEIFRKFASNFQQKMENDCIIRDLVLAILLFQDREHLSCPETIRYQHVLYNYLLRRYLEHKYANVHRAKAKYISLMRALKQIDSVNVLMKAIIASLYSDEQQRHLLENILIELYSL